MKRTSPARLAFCVASLSLSCLLTACSSGGGHEATSAESQGAVAPGSAEAVSSPAAAPGDLLLNGVLVEESVLAGGQPTPEQFARMAEAGYRTVINMRLPDEGGNTQAETVEGLGMTYVTVPIEGAAGLSEERARAFADVLAEVERPVVVHCGSGNRVGALFALKAYHVDGASAEDSIQIGLDAGMTRLEGAVRDQLTAAESSGDS